MLKYKLHILLIVIILLLLSYIARLQFILRTDYDNMPELSCNHIASAYWQRGKRLAESATDNRGKSEHIERYSSISAEIYRLCIMYITNDPASTH